MSAQEASLIKVHPLDIREGVPLPYDIYTAEGALLCAAGDTVEIPQQAAIMQMSGWRRATNQGEQGEQTLPPVQDSSRQASDDELLLPVRDWLPLEQAEVLIAEDMKLARDLLVRMLNEYGISSIHTVDNGHSAITHFFRQRPHLVFIDIYMPLSNGFEVLRQIKTWSPATFVCMASGDCTQANAEQARTLGVNAFIIKPITPLNIKRVLAMYINRSYQ
jgi:two-component system chemotaxis response regulator CheY